MAVTLTCDKCGEALVTRAKVLSVNSWRGGYASSTTKIHLCPEHYREFKTWLGGLRDEDEGEDESPFAR